MKSSSRDGKRMRGLLDWVFLYLTLQPRCLGKICFGLNLSNLGIELISLNSETGRVFEVR